MTAPFLDSYVRAQFQAQGIATMGLDANWDRAVANLLACDIKAHVQEEFGADTLIGHEDDGAKRDAERRYGAKWRDHPDCAELCERSRANAYARDKTLSEQFYEPLWAAQRQLALTPAPSLAAAIWKATLIEVAALWDDLPMEEQGGDCVAIIDADLARFVPQASTFAAALAAVQVARAAEDAYDASTWRPAHDALLQDKSSAPIPEDIDTEMERLQDARCDAEEAMIKTPAPDGAALIEKFKTMRARMDGFCDWPEDWLNAFTADLARVSGAGA